MLHRPLARTAVPMAALLVLAGCGGGGGGAQAGAPADGTSAPAEAAVTVVTSTNVYGSVVSAVGGDRVAVSSIIDDPAADPHSYESTPADAAEVSDADLVIGNGGGYDDFLTQLVAASGRQPVVIDVVELSGLEPADGTGSDEHAAEEHAGEDHDHEHGAFNEHVWYSLPTMATLAQRVATDLGTADPQGAAQYTANAQAFSARIGELTAQAAAIGAAAPGTRVAVTEPVPGYLLATAGLTDATPPEFAEAIEEDTDPPAAVLQQTLALFETDPVRALVLNAQTQTPTTDRVRQAAETAAVPVVEMSETLPEGTTDYLAWMQGQIAALGQAVQTPRTGA